MIIFCDELSTIMFCLASKLITTWSRLVAITWDIGSPATMWGRLFTSGLVLTPVLRVTPQCFSFCVSACPLLLKLQKAKLLLKLTRFLKKYSLTSKGPVTRCNFSCNLQCNSTLGRCKICKYMFPSQFANIFLTY